MPESQQLSFECERCGACCKDQKTIVNVTYDDIRRIRDALDLNLEELNHILAFYVFEEEMDEEDRKKMVVSPVETEKGLAFVGLRKKHDGVCYFYDEKNKKCRIYKARPAFCRTFPFSFEVIEESDETLSSDIKIKYTEKGKQYCPGIVEGHPKIDRQKWLKRGKKTIEELNKNYHIMEKWNEAVKKGEVEKSAMNFLKTILKAKEEESSAL